MKLLKGNKVAHILLTSVQRSKEIVLEVVIELLSFMAADVCLKYNRLHHLIGLIAFRKKVK